jgi:CHAD domain-containing protein
MAAAVDISEHLAAALKEHCKRYRQELRACQRHFSEEAVHQTRIASRRLLSLLELAGSLLPSGRAEAARVLFKRQLVAFNDLRDTHVQLLAAADLRRTFPVAREFHAYLRKREARLTRRARKDIRRLKVRRLRARIADCREEFDQYRRTRAARPAARRLLRALDRAFARVQDLRARIRPDDTRTIHRTRVAFKKFRYRVEAVAPWPPGRRPGRPEALRRYQAMMGEIQDAEVLLGGLDRFARKENPEPAQLERFRAALLRRRERLIRAYLASSGKLDQFWKAL